jgi:hypothetical protein
MEAIYLKIMTDVMDATNEIGGGAYSTPWQFGDIYPATNKNNTCK